ncbi:MAG TPA: response regulator [Gemmataceae bacterium]|jgi:PAS domain S-box-containing protein|nr:response regulator [Gemmataceae bacterium]
MTDALKLFLVEDDDNIALLICSWLERAGYQVTRCRTAADALIVLGHNSYDLVLLDHRLPDMAGLDLLDAFGREGINTPALIVTAYGDEQIATRALQAGALDYIVKDPGLNFLSELPKRVHESVTRDRLQQLNRLLIAALESARDGIMITDLQGTILHVNHALERMTGFARAELIGQNPRLLKNPQNAAELFEGMWQTILTRASWQGDLTNRRKDGNLVDVSLTVSPIVDSRGQLTHFVGIQRDNSERKFLERQLLQAQKMQSVGTLAGGVAHEFNNLLAGISGYASLGLREGGLGITVREFLQNISNLAERAASLTRQMLAFARKPALVRRPVHMRELIQSTAELVTRTMHTQVTVDCSANGQVEDLFVEADANQLQQAVVNLAINARDAQADAASIVFRLHREVLEAGKAAFPETVPPGDYVVVQVEDHGSGMTQEVLNQALDPFFTTKPVGQGTGLGLPVVFGIVRGHQGFLTIDSEPGRGTCIGIYLPRLADPAEHKAHFDFESGQVVEPEGIPGRTILVLDDEPAVRDVIRRFLEIAGHNVACAANSAEALEVLNNGMQIDLLILDLMMPREDGVSAFQLLRKLRPQLPVLLCTGLVAALPAQELVQASSVTVLRKPFRMNELWYAVNQALAAESALG